MSEELFEYHDEDEEEILATPEEMKAEAIRRMKKLKYFKPSIDLFEKEGAVMVNEPPYGAHYLIDESNSPETYPIIAPQIEKLQKNGERLVYAVIMSLSNPGKTFEFLFVEQHKEEWEYFDEDLTERIIFCYCYNASDPQSSEFGSITFKWTIAAGLERVA